MTDYIQLTPHPDTPPVAVTSVEALCRFGDGRWRFRYLVEGIDKLALAGPAEPGRADELWRSTCFEVFVAGQGAAYREYNFAPSGEWAAYAFDAPRVGMREASDEAEVWLEGGETWIAVEGAVSADFGPASPLNLTAVIEEEGGIRSYWALAHPGGPPDFHNRDCFVAHLPPVETP